MLFYPPPTQQHPTKTTTATATATRISMDLPILETRKPLRTPKPQILNLNLKALKNPKPTIEIEAKTPNPKHKNPKTFNRKKLKEINRNRGKH